MSRISSTFQRLADEGSTAFVPFVMGGDPDFETSLALIGALPRAGADLIEIGMPFTDPMADGPAIQRAGQRALAGGQTAHRALDLVRAFRREDAATPVILMGYYNPIFRYGAVDFARDAVAAGVDGVIVVDLPPEEDAEFCDPARMAGLDFIRLATPTTSEARLPAVLRSSAGFVYYVSVAGVTGAGSGDAADVGTAVARLKRESGLPVAVGFGVSTPERAAAMAEIADGVVVGSALCATLEEGIGAGSAHAIDQTVTLARRLADAIKGRA